VDIEVLEKQRTRLGKFVAPLAVALTSSYTAGSAMGMLVQLYLKSLGSPHILIALGTSARSLGSVLGGVILGRLASRYPYKPLLLTSMALGALGLSILIFLPPASLALGAAFARAFAGAGFAAVAMALVSGLSSRRRRGRNLSYITSARSLGLMLGKLAGGGFLAWWGFRGSFVALAALPLLGLLALVPLPGVEAGHGPRKLATLRSLRDWGLLSLFLGALFRQMGTSGFFAFIYVYMADLGIPTGAMGALAALNHALQVLGMLLFGRMSDRVGRRIVFLGGFGLSVLVPLVFALSRGPGGIAAGFALLGIAFSSLYIGSTAHLGDVVPLERQGEILGLFDSTRALGGMFGPVLSGALAPLFGLREAFIAMAAVSGLGFLLVLLRKPRPRASSR
jgi:MFS family permease